MEISFESVIRMLDEAVKHERWLQAARIAKLLLEECTKQLTPEEKDQV